MKSQKGFDVIELLIVLAVLGVMAFAIAMAVNSYFGGVEPANNITDSKDIYRELTSRPISSLNMTELQIAADYLASRHRNSEAAQRAAIYQNQIIITKLDELTVLLQQQEEEQ